MFVMYGLHLFMCLHSNVSNQTGAKMLAQLLYMFSVVPSRIRILAAQNSSAVCECAHEADQRSIKSSCRVHAVDLMFGKNSGTQQNRENMFAECPQHVPFDGMCAQTQRTRLTCSGANQDR